MQGADSVKLERIAPNQIKYIISFEELTYKGFSEEELLEESFVWDTLFDEMLDEASRMFQLESTGAVSIEIYSLTAKELVLILTIDEDEVDELFSSDEMTLKVNLDPIYLTVAFADIEDCITLVNELENLQFNELISTLYILEEVYYLLIEKSTEPNESLLAITEEFGEISTITSAFLDDYGKMIIENNAINILNHYFRT